MDDERKIVGSYFDSCDYTNPDSGTLLADVGDCHDSEGASCVYPYFYHPAQFAFALPVLGIVIITILNDGCMLTIARDHVIPAETPQDWNLPELRLVAVVLGCVPLGSSLLLLWLGLKCADGLYPSWAFLFNRKVPSDYQNEAGDLYYLKYEELLMLMYLKVSISYSDALLRAVSRALLLAGARGPALLRVPRRDGLGDLIAMSALVSDKTHSHVRHLGGVPGGLAPATSPSSSCRTRSRWAVSAHEPALLRAFLSCIGLWTTPPRRTRRRRVRSRRTRHDGVPVLGHQPRDGSSARDGSGRVEQRAEVRRRAPRRAQRSKRNCASRRTVASITRATSARATTGTVRLEARSSCPASKSLWPAGLRLRPQGLTTTEFTSAAKAACLAFSSANRIEPPWRGSGAGSVVPHGAA